MKKVYEKKEKCSGCGACAQACPKEAITMEFSSDGYMYPIIDEERCCGCAICQKKCQYIGGCVRPKVIDNMEIYAAHGNIEEMDGSASGGLFYVAAKEIIKQNGVVFGCVYNRDMVAIHIVADTLEELKPMRNSKYVQSDVGNTYKQVREYLKEGRMVLYSGTPCQIVGLYNYLGQDYSTLITVDLVCAGVTPPKMFAEYIKKLKKEFGAKPTFIDFRDKTEGWGNKWVRIEFEDESKNIRMRSTENEYMKLFTSGYSARASCKKCIYAQMQRYSDITLGDYWGIEQTNAHIDYYDGITKVFVNTAKGRNFYNSILSQINYESMTYETAVRPNLIRNPQVDEQWERFRHDYSKYGYDYVMKKYFAR